jgi:hypothetical protein
MVAPGYYGLVSVEGKEGRGRRPKYHLTAAGERYLNDNQEELKEPVDPPPKPAAEKQDPKPDKYAVVFINGRPAFKKGQRLIARKYVPLAELDRLDKEINAVRNRTDSTTPTFKPQANDANGAAETGVHHKVPEGPKKWDGPKEPEIRPSILRGRPPKAKNEQLYCGVPEGEDPSKYNHTHPMTTVEDCPEEHVRDTSIPTKEFTKLKEQYEQDPVKVAEFVANAPVNDEQRRDNRLAEDLTKLSLRTSFRAVLADLLIERYADTVTAAEIMAYMERHQ